jgi:hypothetical protein
MAVPQTRRKAAEEASKKIQLLGLERGQSGGSRRRPHAHKKDPFPSVSEVLEMETFSVLAIMDSEEEGVEEEIRVNDECVFRNVTPFLEG